MSDEPIDVTAILAQPREFLRRYENVLAQLEQARKEIERLTAELSGIRASLGEALNSGDGVYRP